MKKLHTLLFSLFLLVTIAGDAQIRKGAIFLGGNLGGGTEKVTANNTQVTKNNNLTISPVFGKAIKENLVFGVSTGFSFAETRSKDVSNVVQRGSNYYAGIFLRRYKTIGKSGFAAFVQGDFGGGYGHEHAEQGVFKSENKRYSIGASGYPGLSFAISPKFQLETGFINFVSLGFSTQKSEITPTGTASSFSKSHGFSLNTSLNNFGSSLYLGFRVLLNKS